MDTPIIDNVRITSKGQVTIPKHIRDKLNLSAGDTISLAFEDGRLTIENPLAAAMRTFQKAMEGEAEKAGFHSEEELMYWITEMRRNGEI